MMEPMQRSLDECLVSRHSRNKTNFAEPQTYLRLVQSLPDGLPERSDSDDQPSVEKLEELARSHESMKA